jgi:ribonuclease P protein component
VPLTFTKAMQLTHDREYQRVYAARTSVTKGPLRISAVTNDRGSTRIGLSVPGRVGTNVKRNRIKRLIREAFRLSRADLPSGLDIVIGVHPHEELTVDAYATILTTAAQSLAATWAARDQTAKGQRAK